MKHEWEIDAGFAGGCLMKPCVEGQEAGIGLPERGNVIGGVWQRFVVRLWQNDEQKDGDKAEGAVDDGSSLRQLLCWHLHNRIRDYCRIRSY